MARDGETATDTEQHDDELDYSAFDVPTDLNAFQRDLLCVLATLDEPTGLYVGDVMEELYRQPTNPGRLYPNFEELANMGLIDIHEKDKRTNAYVITRRGLYVVREYRRFIDATVSEV